MKTQFRIALDEAYFGLFSKPLIQVEWVAVPLGFRISGLRGTFQVKYSMRQ
jgi:hypothetical protein